MSLSTDSPTFTDVTAAPAGPVPADTDATTNAIAAAADGAATIDDGSPDDSTAGRAFPGRVRGQRLEITSADLTMYSMITGRAPSREERQRALTWSDADPMHQRIAGRVNAITSSAVLPMHAARPWHPAALSQRLRDIWFNGLTLNRPQIGNWVRRLSAALQQGNRRMKQPR